MVSVKIFGLSLGEMEIAAKLHPAVLAAVREHAKLGFNEADVEVHIPCDLVSVKTRGSIFVEVFIGELLDCEEASMDPLARSVSDAIAPSFGDGRIQVVVDTHQGMHGMYESPKLTAHKTILFYEHAQELSQVEGALQTGADFVFMRSSVSGVDGFHVFVNPKRGPFVAMLKVHPRFRLASPPAYDTVYCNGSKPVIFHADYDLDVALTVDIESIVGFEFRKR